jgi:hypothetical protein
MLINMEFNLKKYILTAIAAIGLSNAALANDYGYHAAKTEVARSVAVGAAVGGLVGFAMPGGPATAWAGAAIGAGAGGVWSIIVKPFAKKN